MKTINYILLLSLLSACKPTDGEDADPSTGATAAPVTSSATDPDAPYDCAEDAPCPDGEFCDGGVTEALPECHPIECVDDTGCGVDEFCYGSVCYPKGETGAACPTGANACTSGVCGTVDGGKACVESCQFRACRQGGSVTGELCDTTPDGQCEGRCSWYLVPGFTACAPGFLCVTGPAEGDDNGHYCWPEGSGDYGMPGDACKLDEYCATKNCIYDAQTQIGACQWSCVGGCPPGQSCNDAFGQKFCE